MPLDWKSLKEELKISVVKLASMQQKKIIQPATRALVGVRTTGVYGNKT